MNTTGARHDESSLDPRPFNAVVAITGAASGVGAAAAARFAAAGARVVLGDRDSEGLADTANRCDAAGRHALPVPTDVRDEAQVQALADAALREHGSIDVWVNGAGQGVIGPFEKIPSEVFREVIETNLMGAVHGARAALGAFRRGDRGVLINVASILAEAAAPLQSPYNASKFAVLGFTDTLRQELRRTPGIRVCAVLPGLIDTPFWADVANYSGRT